MVESTDNLALTAGRFASWRIRSDWPGNFGPRDRAPLWFGGCGELQLVAHLEGVATDENGDPVGMLISDEREVLMGLELVGGGAVLRVTHRGPGPVPPPREADTLELSSCVISPTFAFDGLIDPRLVG